MTFDPAASKPRRIWPWIFLAAVVLLAGATQTFRLVKRSAVEGELTALRQEGYPTAVQDLPRWQGLLADSQNASLKILEAADYLALEPDAFRRELWPMGAEALASEQREALAELLTNNAPALEVLHEGLRLDKAVYPIDYTRGPAALVPHLAKIKSLSQLLKAEAILFSEEGQVERSLQSIRASVALARTLESEPLLISQLVRHACLGLSCTALERVLNQHALSEPQLQSLALTLRSAREASGPAARAGYVGEICLGIYCFRSRPRELAAVTGSEEDLAVWGNVLFPLYAWTGLRDRDFLFYLRSMRGVIESTKRPFPERMLSIRSAHQHTADVLGADRLLVLSRMLLPALERSQEKAAENEALLRCAETALLVEEIRARNQGELPAELSARVSPALETVAVDPITGGALRYQPLRPGYVVYSVGADGADDGGEARSPERSNRRGRSDSGYDVVFTVHR